MSCLCCSVCFSFLCRWTMWRKTVVFRMPQPYWCPRREVVCSTLQWTVSSPIPRPRWTAALSTGTPTATMSGFIAQHLSSTMWLVMRNLLCLEKKKEKKRKHIAPPTEWAVPLDLRTSLGLSFPCFSLMFIDFCSGGHFTTRSVTVHGKYTMRTLYDLSAKVYKPLWL